MKILFSDTTYSYLFPGGKQVHADKLYSNLQKIGVDVEYENWYNPELKGDIVHFFGYNDFNKIITLKKKGYKLVYTHIMDGLTNVPNIKQGYHKYKNKIIYKLPNKFTPMFPWRALNNFDAIVYMHENDRKTAIKIYNIDPNITHVIPHAVDELPILMKKENFTKNKYLVSLGSIVPRKNAILTAKICSNNNIPIKFIGHPMDQKSAYFNEFLKYIDGNVVEYLGYVTKEKKNEILSNASGFILLSLGESGCISVYEAASFGLPLLLSDLPWAKGYEEPNNLSYCTINNLNESEKIVVNFFNLAIRQNYPTIKVRTWQEVAKLYANLYVSIL